jgi:hypothetical protein
MDMNGNVEKLILETVSEVLLEGRLEDVKAKYDEDKASVIDTLSQSDPSGNNKYLEWMAKVSFSDTADFSLEDITNVVKAYHENIQRLTSDISTPIVDANKDSFPGRAERRIKNNPKDISGYPSLGSLKLITDSLEETKKERPDRDRIYQDDRWTVIVPKTHDAACKYGVHSNWCVSTSNKRYFSQYTEDRDALLFFILWRNKRDSEDKSEYKVAINPKYDEWETPKKWSWYDMPDHDLDPNLMLNVLPSSMIEKIQRYLLVEGKRQGKIIDTGKLLKLIDDNSKYKFGERSNRVYFTTDNVEVFSFLPNYNNAFEYIEDNGVDGMNTVVSVNKTTGRFSLKDVRSEMGTPVATYKHWFRHYSDEKDYVTYIYGLSSELTIPQELRDEVETKVKQELIRVGGMWIQTRTNRLTVGDIVRWKKGRGYWNQRNNSWNESIIDRQTPSGYLVTGKTDEYPNGKRFKPNYNTTMDVWHPFDENLDLSGRDN